MIEIPDFELHPSINPESKEGARVQEILKDLWTCLVSREASLLGRREVLTGKAKFGIFGGGKELPQVVLAKFFKKGDHRSGYYRDQTFAFAIGESTVEQFFAQLYADVLNDPFSGGRQMNAHFATPYIDKDDQWTDHVNRYNISSDISPTAGQMARAFGLAHASKIYKNGNYPDDYQRFSLSGNEVCHCDIGDASTSEGVFWETMNAAAVTGVPLSVSVWDDGYGISVPLKYQTVKQSISEALRGFTVDEFGQGMRIYKVKGHDYAALINAYDIAIQRSREEHRPSLIHVIELTQPQGHSTSGSHERYKDQERLQWEKKNDCNERFIQWILDHKFTSEEHIDALRKQAKTYVKECKNRAWSAFLHLLPGYKQRVLDSVNDLELTDEAIEMRDKLAKANNISYYEIVKAAEILGQHIRLSGDEEPANLRSFISESYEFAADAYHSRLYAKENYLDSDHIPADFTDSEEKNGYEVLNHYFDKLFETRTDVLAFGEDVGYIGDVNQGFAGVQKKYGENRIFDTGIREWTIVGQAIGMAMRGLRPIAEIQYLDYIMYAISPLTDDLATLRYRSNGLQKAPAIIRTRGHRLEGIWHAGSHMGMLIHSLRGMHICVPRDMTRAVGFYNTLLAGDDPALVIEVLNGYRLKEKLPQNILEYSVPLGVPEILTEGEDITIVTYGACVKEALHAAEMLHGYDIYPEIIDVQCLLPFDVHHMISKSLEKTNRVLFLDEDVPGGATAYMMQEVLEVQGAYQYLDASPSTLTAFDHRTPFGSDGDYFTKPTSPRIVDKVLEILSE